MGDSAPVLPWVRIISFVRGLLNDMWSCFVYLELPIFFVPLTS